MANLWPVGRRFIGRRIGRVRRNVGFPIPLVETGHAPSPGRRSLRESDLFPIDIRFVPACRDAACCVSTDVAVDRETQHAASLRRGRLTWRRGMPRLYSGGRGPTIVETPWGRGQSLSLLWASSGVTVKVVPLGRVGRSNMRSVMMLSMMERRPRAPRW